MGCVELCNFHFCCAAIFCQPMKNFELFGLSRATRERHFKTSSTGDENVHPRISLYRYGSDFNPLTPELFAKNAFFGHFGGFEANSRQNLL